MTRAITQNSCGPSAARATSPPKAASPLRARSAAQAARPRARAPRRRPGAATSWRDAAHRLDQIRLGDVEIEPGVDRPRAHLQEPVLLEEEIGEGEIARVEAALEEVAGLGGGGQRLALVAAPGLLGGAAVGERQVDVARDLRPQARLLGGGAAGLG